MQNMEAATVRWGDWIGEGWQMFAEQWQGWVLLILVFLLVVMVPVVPLYAFMFAAQLAAAREEEPQLPASVFVVMIIFYPVIIILSSYLLSGAYKAAFKQLHGERIGVGDLFSGGSVFLRVVGAVLLIALLSAVGAIFCILPGLIVGGLLYFTVPLIVEGNLGVIDAMKTSFERTKGSWFMFTLFAIVVNLLAQLGAVACGVGLLATFPLLFTIAAIAYRDTFGVAGARHFGGRQVPPPSAYGSQTWSQSAQPEPPRPIPPPQVDESNLQCPRCGARLMSPSAKFCNICGTNLQA